MVCFIVAGKAISEYKVNNCMFTCLNEVMLLNIFYVKIVNKQIQKENIHVYSTSLYADCNHLLRLPQISLITA